MAAGPLLIFAIVYALIVTERLDRTAAALLGALAVVFLGYIPAADAFARVDLNVIFLLAGMMITVEVLSQTGLFEWVAVVIAQRARGNGLAILLGLMAATAFLSAFLDNVTTVVLIVPITILITQILEIPATPFLLLEAIGSNIGGTATLIGDPPNILIGSRSGLNFNDFLLNTGPLVIILMATLLLAAYFIFGAALRPSAAARENMMRAEPHRAITQPRRLRRALPVFLLTLAGFAFCHAIHVEPGFVALLGAMITVLVTGSSMRTALEKVEWETIFFLIGLFILIGALEHNGLFQRIGAWMLSISQGNRLTACLALLWMAGLLSAFLGAVPVTIALMPLVQTMIPALTGQEAAAFDLTHPAAQPLWWSLALGACLGGNGTILGTAANVVVTQIAARNHYPVSFTRFMRYGTPITLLSLTISSVYIWLRYFVLT